MDTISIIFNEKPNQWGFRGDPYFWDYLAEHFKKYEFPMNPNDFEKIIFNQFYKVSGEQLTVNTIVKVKQFAHEGMSSGVLSGDYWINQAIPLLKSRLNENNSKYEESILKWNLNLPEIYNYTNIPFITKINEIINYNLENIIEKDLNDKVKKGKLKKFKKQEVKYKGDYNIGNPNKNEIGILDLKATNTINLRRLQYTLSFPINYKEDIEKLEIKQEYIEDDSLNSIFITKYPWKCELERITVNFLKTQINITIGFLIQLFHNYYKPRKIRIEDIQGNKNCQHEFKLFQNNTYDWSLI